MGHLRFSRRIRIVPGLTLNLTKHGASVSVGVRGAHLTVGTSGTRATVGLPGTGLSYTATQGRKVRRAKASPAVFAAAATSIAVPVEPAARPASTALIDCPFPVLCIIVAVGAVFIGLLLAAV